VIKRHENMQKLDRRNTYTPWNAALVPCNCDPVLKAPRGKSGVQGLKTFPNNSEEHLLVGRLQDGCRDYPLQKPPFNSLEELSWTEQVERS